MEDYNNVTINYMEDFEKQFCRLCHNFISDTNFSTIDDATREVLDVVLLKLNLEGNCTQVMCKTCSEKLNAAFEFKSKCRYTNDTIFPYVDFENLVPVDLKDIYVKQKGISVLVDQEICRLCMEPVKKQFISVEDVDVGVFQNYIPEVMLDATKYPIICKSCHDALVVHSSFIKNCLEAEKNVKKTCNDDLGKNPSHAQYLNLYIKSEVIEDEKDNETIVKTEPNIEEVEEINEEKLIKTEWEVIEEERMHSHQIPQTSRMTRRDECDKKVNEGNLDMFQCDSYKYKSDLPDIEDHQSIDKDPKEEWHFCDVCDYFSKKKNHLRRHMLIHKDPSETVWHECDVCGYKCRARANLTRHMLVHIDDSIIQWHKCDICNYKSKYKGALNRHMSSHKHTSELKLYKCEICNCKLKQKSYYKRHLLNHKDPSLIWWYHCDRCSYKSKMKHDLKMHVLMVHRESSEIKWYKCDMCDYKCKLKCNLRRHIKLIHKDPSEIQWYACVKCDYKSKTKGNLKKHMLIHGDAKL